MSTMGEFVPKVTLADISREAGLGKATVSRALAVEPHPDVSEETRARVKAVADRLGYRPSVTARALRAGGYHAISAVIPDNAWGWWEPAVRAAFLEAGEHGYHVLAHAVAGRPGGAASVVEDLANVPTEGILLFGSSNDTAVLRAANALRLPTVAIDDVNDEVRVPTITVDNVAGAYQATTYLIQSGRRRIAYLGSGAKSTLFERDRLAGYKKALAEHGLEVDPELVVYDTAWKWDDGETPSRSAPIEYLVDRGISFDAVFCEFDMIAAPALRSLRRAGLSVPADVAIVGFDDDLAAQLLDPQLTTIRQPYERMGRNAVRKLLAAIGGERLQPTRELEAPELIRRESA
ncbi:LacI family DNA-binding transcriptional regulator [Arthrobacter sp. ISL-85]|uniref:LacI family DNA-binding transcriptional regulator n=1 Tax=Arthrobacter sp. ISL-85 TaxID=2819115 RepID=UPI001BE5A5F7|nr:LacI family DNA-binding transcriptional regulator [Arthrobacter sp. ISL-85]MBT2565238.1 LacI family DNA-binding transcriptional regulator [Arthrobacter sp. ISL-85]